MSISASFTFPGDVEKSFTVAKCGGLLSKRIVELKAECMKQLGEYLETQNIDVAEADKVDVFEERVSDDDEPAKKPRNKKQKTKAG
mmetsp:Transcript_17412/g.37877  ORF Transcript_17412/g.37877 Transcript_17412/m.37877 type:complete len:86 (+) Transcript_17412:232-489(+)|eukprot:CAMPEP_0118939086 /NCGR_PEP_ID=MMETSP1169-20130426/27915_1 /TAXON_ID=36882 /ORGANISM="Pyramimonas obovata, Strain CCMP722" /LENGTH=85 /DNA_ID=CAMNT_0006883269 /DNA_START=174 /DNA_END=431 /DNA_ORIENTATION=+